MPAHGPEVIRRWIFRFRTASRFTTLRKANGPSRQLGGLIDLFINLIIVSVWLSIGDF